MEISQEQISNAHEAVYHATHTGDSELVYTAASVLMRLLYRGELSQEIEAVFNHTKSSFAQTQPGLLYWRAKARQRQGDSQGALRMFETLQKQGGNLDEYTRADMLLSIGYCYKRINQHGKSIKYYEDALGFIADILRRPRLSIANIAAFSELRGIALLHRGLYRQHWARDFNDALADYTGALEIFKDLGETSLEASVFYNLADLHNDPRNGETYDSGLALKYALDGHEIAENGGHATEEALTAYLLGKILSEKSPQQALDYFLKAKTISGERLRDEMEAAIAESRAVRLSLSLHQIEADQAVERWKAALQILRKYDEDSHAARVGADTALSRGVMELLRSNYAGLNDALNEAEWWTKLPVLSRPATSDHRRRLRLAMGRALLAEHNDNSELAARIASDPSVTESLRQLGESAEAMGSEQYRNIFLKEP